MSLWRACFGRNMNVAVPALEAPGSLSVCTLAAPLAASVSVRHAGRGQGPMQLAQGGRLSYRPCHWQWRNGHDRTVTRTPRPSPSPSRRRRRRPLASPRPAAPLTVPAPATAGVPLPGGVSQRSDARADLAAESESADRSGPKLTVPHRGCNLEARKAARCSLRHATEYPHDDHGATGRGPYRSGVLITLLPAFRRVSSKRSIASGTSGGRPRVWASCRLGAGSSAAAPCGSPV